MCIPISRSNTLNHHLLLLEMWVTIPLPLACRASALPIELISNFELMEGVEPTYLRYKGNVMTIIRHQRYFEHLEGFEPP